MKTLKIGGKDYTLEYGFEAALNEECVDKVINLAATIATAENINEIETLAKKISAMPGTVLSLFYAGLIEHHGEDGDGTVLDKKQAKNLMKQYSNENPGAEDSTFAGMNSTILECMEDDGFFKQIGLDFEEEKENQPKVPTDHKPKASKASKK